MKHLDGDDLITVARIAGFNVDADALAQAATQAMVADDVPSAAAILMHEIVRSSAAGKSSRALAILAAAQLASVNEVAFRFDDAAAVRSQFAAIARGDVSPAEMRVWLATLVVTHGLDADDLVRTNRGLVAQMVERYSRPGLHGNLSKDQLVAAGDRGLHLAAEKFDPTSGFKFSIYAKWWIRQAITQAIHNARPAL